MYKPSGNPKVLELIKSIRDRSYNLDSIQAIKLEELNEKGKPKRLCAWCAEKELYHGNQKYCSSLCSNSALATFYPQKEDGIRFLLIKQYWKCSGCQYDYRPYLEKMVLESYKGFTPPPLENISWYYFKRLKNRVPKEHRPEVDHIVPIYKGGESLGLENHQLICYTCHKEKTKKDLSGKRK